MQDEYQQFFNGENATAGRGVFRVKLHQTSMHTTFSTMYLTIGLPISGFLALVSLVAMLAVTFKLKYRYKNANWTPVAAVVEESGMTKKNYGRGTFIYTPVIQYQYSFGQKLYRSSTISPDLHYAGSSDKSDAQKWVVLFPAGTGVTAYVDRENPATAVLFPDYRYGWWYVLVITFAVFGGCNILLLIIFAAVT